MSELNLKHTDAATEAKLLTITSLTGDHEAFNAVMDYLKDHRSQMDKVAQQLEAPDARSMDGLFGVNVKIEKNHNGHVTAIDFSHGGGGGGIGGFFSSVAHDVEGAVKDVAHDVDDAGKVVVHGAVHAADAAGRILKAVGKGALNEVEHHTGTILLDAGIGLGFGVAFVLAPEIVAPIGALVLGAGLVINGKRWVKSAGDLVHDAGVLYDPNQHSARERAQATQGFETFGADFAQVAAATAGGAAGGFGASVGADSIGISPETADGPGLTGWGDNYIKSGIGRVLGRDDIGSGPIYRMLRYGPIKSASNLPDPSMASSPSPEQPSAGPIARLIKSAAEKTGKSRHLI